nr:zinc finger BED domain-containing protein RICESLEEPER 2-like [Ipomoea batatas]
MVAGAVEWGPQSSQASGDYLLGAFGRGFSAILLAIFVNIYCSSILGGGGFSVCIIFVRFLVLNYGESPVGMKDMLSEFFRLISPAKITMCACVEGKRMQMSWRDSKNKIDYGVCLMRYMEMYVGQGVSKWGMRALLRVKLNKLHQLRLNYMKELAVSGFNVHISRNLSRAYQHISVPLAPS